MGTKTEIKNMNSFKAVKAGLEYEINRQERLILAGETIIQETRLWDENKAVTIAMRTKEESHDYRYFPEPDLVPLLLESAYIDEMKATLPELPAEKLERIIQTYSVSEYDARIIIQDQLLASFFEECAKSYNDIKKICNWMIGPLLKELNERKKSIQHINLQPRDFSDLIKKVEEGALSNLSAKAALTAMIDSGKSAQEVIQEQGLAQVSDEDALMVLVNRVIIENPDVAQQIRKGKESAIGFLVGQTMKKSQGKGNPKRISELIKKLLIT